MNGKRIKGVINWYDEYSKEGSIISLDGIWYRIHQYTKLNKFTIPQEGDHITFQLALDSIRPIVQVVSKTKKHKLPKTKKRIPIVKRVSIKVKDEFTGRRVSLSGYQVVNYHWLEVYKDDNKLEAITGMFNEPQGALAMWNGNWDEYCGHKIADSFIETKTKKKTKLRKR